MYNYSIKRRFAPVNFLFWGEIMILHGPILLSAGGMNFFSVLIPFVLSASLMAIVFFAMRAIHRKRHPTEEDVKETNRKRREREKLERETMAKMNEKLSGKKHDEESGEYEKRGLRSGKYKKKKKK